MTKIEQAADIIATAALEQGPIDWAYDLLDGDLDCIAAVFGDDATRGDILAVKERVREIIAERQGA